MSVMVYNNATVFAAIYSFNKYFDFGAIGVATLLMVAGSDKIELTEEDAKKAANQISLLKPHSEVKEALVLSTTNRFKLVSFTDSSNSAGSQQLKMLRSTVFSTKVSAQKISENLNQILYPSLGIKEIEGRNNECLLIAAHGWDTAGALWAGWQGAFKARPGQQLFPLAPQPELVK